MEEKDKEKNNILDEIILNRRSIREFKPDVPPKEDIEAILGAGLQGPFVPFAVFGEKNFRRFFVLKLGENTKKLSVLIRKRLKILSDSLNQQYKENPAIKGDDFAKIIRDVADNFEIRSPYFIIVAERQGFHQIGQLSLAHCLENMWLKATALGLGFQLMSVIAEMANDPELLKIIDTEPGEYVLNACSIGYPIAIPPKIERPLLKDVTTWIN